MAPSLSALERPHARRADAGLVAAATAADQARAGEVSNGFASWRRWVHSTGSISVIAAMQGSDRGQPSARAGCGPY